MTKGRQTEAYFVRVGAARVGPVTLDQLERGVKAGKIPEHAKVKAATGGEWKPVAEIARRIVLPAPRTPSRPGQPEPSWSAFHGGEVVTPDDAPPLPEAAGRAAPTTRSDGAPAVSTKTFSPPRYLVFVPGSAAPPAGPFRLSVLRARLGCGAFPPTSLVCEVDEFARWIPIDTVFQE